MNIFLKFFFPTGSQEIQSVLIEPSNWRVIEIAVNIKYTLGQQVAFEK